MNTVPLWIALLGVAAPLIALAGSAVAYVIRLYQDAKTRRRDQFFEMMKFIDSKDHPIATKIAAVYSLRQFPEHREFIVRFCRTQGGNVGGPGSSLLIAEMDLTREFFDS